MTSSGDIDWPAFDHLLAKQAEAGIHGIVISGTTGEAPTLSVQEKLSLIRRARTRLPQDISVMAGATSSSTTQCVELCRLSVESGANMLLVATPPYSKPSMGGLKKHFAEIYKACPVPVCLYHVPGRTAQTLTWEELSELASIDNVVSVKEASGDLSLFAQAAAARPDISFLTGDDFTYLPSLAAGGHGTISVVSNIFPREMVAVWDTWQARKHAEAIELYRRLLPVVRALFCESNPGPIKAALAHADIGSNTLRAPLAPISDKAYAALVTVLEDFKKTLQDC